MNQANRLWAYRKTWSGPGIGEVVVNREAGLGLIRVPKCASSSAAKAWKTTEGTSITDSNLQGIDIYAAVREPRSRFLSGLAESLFRLTVHGSSWAGDLPVDPITYERFLSLDASSPASYARAVMRRLEAGEFPELHLTPMFHFIFRADGSPRIPAMLYRSADSDRVVALVAGRYGISSPKGGPSQENVRKQSGRYSNRLPINLVKAHLAKWRAQINAAHWRHFPSDHPILQLSGRKSPITSYQLGKTIEDFDREIREDYPLIQEIQEFVDEYYRRDFLLYRLVESWTRSAEVFANLKTLTTHANAVIEEPRGLGTKAPGDLKA